MSCSAIQRNEQYNHQAMNKPLSGQPTGNFAELDSAFSPSREMVEFQQKMKLENPALTRKAPTEELIDQTINDNLTKLIQSDLKIDVDSITNSENPPFKRDAYNNFNGLGSELLEGFHPYRRREHGFMRLLFTILMLIVLFYLLKLMFDSVSEQKIVVFK